jgi:hypothetical protein
MKRLALVAALLLAAPAFAQSYPGDDDSWQDAEPPPQPYGQPQEQYGQPQAPPPPMPGEAYGEPEAPPPNAQPYAQPPGYGQPGEAPGYAPLDSGPTYADFQSDPSLSSAGIWVETPDYGRVWRPTRVGPDWQPYLYGHWAYTEAGWAWISDEPFGWATYHYGRWAVLGDGGWAWLPGRVWGPAWVAWRYDNGYSAWCPLGPRGIVYEQPREWVVVDNRHFLEPVHRYVLPLQRRREIVVRAPVYRGPRAGPPVVTIGRATGRPVRPLVVVDGNARRPTVGSGSVTFYRPRTAPVVVNRSAINRQPVVNRPIVNRPVLNRPQTIERQPAPDRNRVPQTFGDRQSVRPPAAAQPRPIETPHHERTAQPETLVRPQQPWQQQRTGQPAPQQQQRTGQPVPQQQQRSPQPGAQQRAPWQQPRTQPQPGMQPHGQQPQPGAQQRAGQPQQRPGQPQQRQGQPQQVRPQPVRPRPVVVQPNRPDEK